jgi:hypothetical protein
LEEDATMEILRVEYTILLIVGMFPAGISIHRPVVFPDKPGGNRYLADIFCFA